MKKKKLIQLGLVSLGLLFLSYGFSDNINNGLLFCIIGGAIIGIGLRIF